MHGVTVFKNIFFSMYTFLHMGGGLLPGVPSLSKEGIYSLGVPSLSQEGIRSLGGPLPGFLAKLRYLRCAISP